MHRFPRLVRPWHTLSELRRSQFRVSGAAHAVDDAEQRRLRGEMLALEHWKRRWGGGPFSVAVNWTRVADTANGSADGYGPGYA